MRRARAAAALLAALLLVIGVCVPQGFAAVMPFETQYEYAAAESSWLTDLVIKENMDTAPGLGTSVPLVPQPDYPYTETPEHFREEVDRFCEIYTLTPSSPRASYVLLFDFLNTNGGAFTSQVTDEAVRDYLERAGVEYPADTDADDLVFARALYNAMVTGAYVTPDAEGTDPSVSLDRALVTYLTSLSGMREDELREWAPETGILSVDDYMLAASRLLLWSNGFEVSPDTDEETVYRLTAVLTLRNMGVNASADASFEELQAAYTAALLGRRYNVNADPQKLTEARAENAAAYYVLQLLGREAGLSIRPDRYTYEEAFNAVAENTSAFSLEEGEFYADIYRYSAQLRYRSGYIWVYPTAYLTGVEDADFVVAINNTTVKNNYFNQIRLDPDEPMQVVKIVVDATVDGQRSFSAYYITVYQGAEDYVPEKTIDFESLTGTSDSSESIINQILSKFGVSPSIMSAMDDVFYTMLPAGLQGVLSFIAPSFGDLTGDGEPVEDAADGTQTDAADAVTAQTPISVRTEAYFRDLLDRMGLVVDSVITGVRGVDLGSRKNTDGIRYNFITLE